MYDVIRASYQFHCPRHPHGELHAVALSRFRSIERLPGAAHPAVFRVTYHCDCGDPHVGLASHDDLEYAPIGAADVTFRNLLTGRTEPVWGVLLGLARPQVPNGNRPWQLVPG